MSAETRAPWRACGTPGAANDHAPATYPQQYAVEDYRYDALGRRVWLRARRWCDDQGLDRTAGTECRSGLIRRTIWDGAQELAEIQMPWALQGKDLYAKWDTRQTPEWWENDTEPVPLGRLDTMDPVTGDPNPLFGRVLYAGFTATDQPLAVTRVGYVWRSDWYYPTNSYDPQTEPPFTITPFWTAQGDAPLGVMTGGVLTNCDGPGLYDKCVGYYWPWYVSAFDRQRNSARGVWHGTLLESKRDESGLGYARHRYYDPATGRFTQEDPIGLAGGLNLYGFANGDPVNFSDPFGLSVCYKGPHVQAAVQATEQATGSSITLDDRNCISTIKANSDDTGLAVLRARLQAMVDATDTEFGVEIYDPLPGFPAWKSSAGSDLTVHIGVDAEGWFFNRYATRRWGLCVPLTGRPSNAAFVAHELLGHLYGQYEGWKRTGRVAPTGEPYAWAAQNHYHQAAGQRARCGN